ncbi:MAG TPA: hypothetical protein VIJ25_10245, partial [Methylococcales bacterium]
DNIIFFLSWGWFATTTVAALVASTRLTTALAAITTTATAEEGHVLGVYFNLGALLAVFFPAATL